MALWHFKNYYADKSVCCGSCDEKWLAYYTEKITAAGLNTRDIGSIKRADGTKQITYKGHLLYFFTKD